MKPWMLLLAAAALTIGLSPSLRNAGLRLLFYRDFPVHPLGWAPKFYTYEKGVRLS